MPTDDTEYPHLEATLMSGTHAIRTHTRLRSTWLLLFGAVLAGAVVAAHVKDQGGLMAMTSPHWLGWAYRALEIGGALVFFALIARFAVRVTWFCAFLVGLGPFVGYILTRSTGLPHANDDIGNWTDPLGLASLCVEGLLMIVSLVALSGLDRREDVTVVRDDMAYPTEPIRSARARIDDRQPVS